MGDGPEGEGALAISAWALAQDLTEMGEPAQAAQAVHQLVDLGLLALPHPRGGRTPERIAALVALGAAECVLTRPAEGHAIFSELKGPEPGPGQLWGVSTARPPGVGAVGVAACWTGKVARIPASSGASRIRSQLPGAHRRRSGCSASTVSPTRGCSLTALTAGSPRKRSPGRWFAATECRGCQAPDTATTPESVATKACAPTKVGLVKCGTDPTAI